MQIGDYLLRELAYEGTTTRTWLAQQISVGRDVIIDSLNLEEQQSEETVTAFLADVRAKARVDHPLIGSVFEAIREGRLCFYAREFLHGDTLEELAEQNQKILPINIAHIIRQIAEANLYLEKNGIASLPILPEQIFIGDDYLARLVNMAVGGQRDHDVSTTDKHTIATTLLNLLKSSEPGATRTKSLLEYMADLDREIPLTWEQIRDLSDGVERQLTTSQETLPLESSTMRLHKKQWSKKSLIILASLLGATALISIIALIATQKERPKARELSEMVMIPAGKYPTHDGTRSSLQQFWIDAHEVSIEEYAEFLQFMANLSPEQQTNYQHEDQPETKTSHIPDGWDALYAAAKRGDTWNGRTVTINCPVTGIDWWDAYSYSERHGRRLPSQEEWFAALSTNKKGPDAITPSPWGPVDKDTQDVTSTGIHGLAGNVSEWTRKVAKNPVYPTKPKMPVLVGGSYAKPTSKATSREWLDPETSALQDTRNLRRPDIGFRTLSETEPEAE